MAAEIGIAVVRKADCYLVGVRSGQVPLSGYSEFPGGKCQPGEPSNVCAERECCEETGLVVRATEKLLTVSHDYDHGSVILHFWQCELITVQIRPHAPFRWIPRTELSACRFPEANAGVLELL